jgi:hypothetical protein
MCCIKPVKISLKTVMTCHLKIIMKVKKPWNKTKQKNNKLKSFFFIILLKVVQKFYLKIITFTFFLITVGAA